jgi:energy-coupling factor transporter transmembrane protein EcfT
VNRLRYPLFLTLLVAAAGLAGCGASVGKGKAQIWITRDYGATVLRTGTAPAGLTALQGLERIATAKTGYGGAFVTAIDGVSSSRLHQSDWFYFVNGYESDRGAASYRLRAGDVEWWDYHSWRGQKRPLVVIGAFPEPFIHGYDGRKRPAAVRYQPGFRSLARGLARIEPTRSPRRAAGARRRAPWRRESRRPGPLRGQRKGLRPLVDPQPGARPLPLPGVDVRPLPALALLSACVVAALVATHPLALALLAATLLALLLQASWRRARLFLLGIAVSSFGLFLIWPLTAHVGSHPLWNGPILPVLGSIDVTREELAAGAVQTLRLAAVALAFAVWALRLDQDRLVRETRIARRSVLTVALATRLLPTLERDAAGFIEALRGRGIAVEGIRGRSRLLAPLVASSLERALMLAESMEARGYGRRGRPRSTRTCFNWRERGALALSLLLAISSFLWL